MEALPVAARMNSCNSQKGSRTDSAILLLGLHFLRWSSIPAARLCCLLLFSEQFALRMLSICRHCLCFCLQGNPSIIGHSILFSCATCFDIFQAILLFWDNRVGCKRRKLSNVKSACSWQTKDVFPEPADDEEARYQGYQQSNTEAQC